MNCPKCGGDNPDTSKFCGHCGSRLPDKDPAADIKKTAAFDLGQLPFGGGGSPGAGGGPTLVQTAIQTAVGAEPDPNTVTTPDPEPTPQPAVASPALAPVPSTPPKADSPPVSASSAGPTTVQPVLPDEPEPAAAPEPTPEPAAAPEPAAEPEPEPAAAEPEPEPAAATEPEPEPAAATEPEPAAEPEPQDRTAEEPPPANREFNSAPNEVLAEPAKPAEKADFGADAPAKAKPADLGKAAAKKDQTPAPGQFRETKWFMDALDPEKLNRVELDDIRDRGEQFVDDGSEIDESFSLRSGMHAKVRPTQLDLAKAELQAAERRSRGNGALIGLVLLVLGGIGAAAWFLFLR